MRDGITISDTRHDLASTALFEITHISIGLREMLAKDLDEEVFPIIARGMLARVQQLSEAISECLAPAEDGWRGEAELFEAIECLPAQREQEAAHG